MYELDLEKYGLQYFKTIPMQEWSAEHVEKWIFAFKQERIAPRLPILFTQAQQLLTLSHCTRCGTCCQQDLSRERAGGIYITKQELKNIARQTNTSYRSLRKKARMWENRLHLSFPCIFYDKDLGCSIYQIRPPTCRLYPVKPAPYEGQLLLCVDLQCDYGEEIYRVAFEAWRKEKPIF